MMQDTKFLHLVLTEEIRDNLHSLVQTYQPLILLEHIQLSIMRLCMSDCVWYIKIGERGESRHSQVITAARHSHMTLCHF